ncbi:DUF7856 family protein [Haloarchaeobius amylolyticus]|uniref:DUF7856 family protein n=1 Tax=Haloarchaeobius amylolyticus TaxID=1198296 RepID=UPI002270C362|nr:hypothetical protein [Haloarchaeobius amylolyticus]
MTRRAAPDRRISVASDGWVRTGRAIDLRDRPVDADALAAAIRGDHAEDAEDADGSRLRVTAPALGPVHDHVAVVAPGVSFSRRRALAAVARSRGLVPPQAAALREVEAAMADPATAAVDLEGARRQVAAASAEEDRLRERVATLQGELRARRDVDAATEAVAADLQETLRELTDVETARIAAEQALSQVREAARAGRDARERELRLVDRRDNLRRAATAWLAGELEAAFESALTAVPGGAAARDATASGDDPVSAALAVVRLASLAAPVVLACGRFDSAADAAAVLDAPVVIV